MTHSQHHCQFQDTNISNLLSVSLYAHKVVRHNQSEYTAEGCCVEWCFKPHAQTGEPCKGISRAHSSPTFFSPLFTRRSTDCRAVACNRLHNMPREHDSDLLRFYLSVNAGGFLTGWKGLALALLGTAIAIGIGVTGYLGSQSSSTLLAPASRSVLNSTGACQHSVLRTSLRSFR